MCKQEFMVDKLAVSIFETRKEMGKSAAEKFYNIVKGLLQTKEQLNIVFAAAPSQKEFLDSLTEYDIDWGKINVYHMDEYVGISITDQQSFARFVKHHDNCYWCVFDRFIFRYCRNEY